MSQSNKTVFLDTNVFLHYNPFDQIGWLDLLDSPKATIVFPPVTIRELNKQKELHPRKHIRERATRTLKKLSNLFGSNNWGSVSPNVEAYLEDREPSVDFADHGLQKEVQDDNLIASILSFQARNPEADAVLVTSDEGLTLIAKARRFQIVVLTLTDDHKLPEETDQDQKRVRELEDEVRLLKANKPVLSLTFEDGNDYTSFPIAAPVEKQSSYFDTQVEELKQKYPKWQKGTPTPGKESTLASEAMSAILRSGLAVIPDKDIDEYNLGLDQFIDSYRTFLEKEVSRENMQRRTIELKIYLTNDGTSPAEDIDIRMHFEDGCTLYKTNDLPIRPVPPTPPEKPKPEFMKMFERPLYVRDLPLSRPPYYPTAISQPPRNVSSLRIQKSKSFDVEGHVKHLKHNMREALDPFYVVFDSYDCAVSFNIACRILADNIPLAVEQKLNIVIAKGES